MAYTNIDDPSVYFQIALWTGGNDTSRTITNDGNSDLQPDLIWAKSRTSTSYTDNHFMVDSSRGRLKGLVPNNNSSETTTTGNATQQAERDLVSFNTDGFTVGQVNSTAALNAIDASLIAWQWKANGGTTSSNTTGSINSTVQVNADAGFSIVQYTGTGTAATIGHGLGVAPKWIIVKNRNNSGGTNWVVYHDGLTSNAYHVYLNGTNAQSNSIGYWNSTSPTSSVFSIKGGSDDVNNTTGNNYIAYCFAEKQGYSKFGKYIGNGNANGAFVYTGFKPAFIMGKRANTTGNWFIVDSKRDIDNPADKRLFANTTNAESTSTNNEVDLLSNGFKLRRNLIQSNGNGSTYIFMAFAENPFVTSTGIPTTAR